MSEDTVLVVDGTEVRFVRSPAGGLRVLAGGTDVGSLEPLENGGGYVARRPDGKALARASQWGGEVTASFGSKELAVRALFELG